MTKDESSGAVATAEKKKSEPRDYIVLGKRPDGSWRELGVTKALTDKKAIAPHAIRNEEVKAKRGSDEQPTQAGAGTETYDGFVAVPKRSWHPRQPRAKTDPQLSWS